MSLKSDKWGNWDVKKGDKVIELNLSALKAGCDFTAQHM